MENKNVNSRYFQNTSSFITQKINKEFELCKISVAFLFKKFILIKI